MKNRYFVTLRYFGLDSRETFFTVRGWVLWSKLQFAKYNFSVSANKTHENCVYGHEKKSGWKAWKKAFDEFFMNSITTKLVGI